MHEVFKILVLFYYLTVQLVEGYKKFLIIAPDRTSFTFNLISYSPSTANFAKREREREERERERERERETQTCDLILLLHLDCQKWF
jgi:hypothetical protein